MRNTRVIDVRIGSFYDNAEAIEESIAII
jgi:hypothetical protein